IMELLYLAIFTLHILSGSNALRCYSCQNSNVAFDKYDAECGISNYNGETIDCDDCKSCWIGVYDSGTVYRSTGNKEDGECTISDGYTACYCSGDTCNSGLCEYCDPNYTTTTIQTNITTTTLPNPTTTPIPGEGVRCYNCVNCPTVDGSTTIIQRPGHKTCSTGIFLTNSMVVRGSSDKTHPDGECTDEGDAFTCFCTGDLCNDDSFRDQHKMNDVMNP
ncbi:unnamed protein product, partial [Meganyctiphanes norvegica]